MLEENFCVCVWGGGHQMSMYSARNRKWSPAARLPLRLSIMVSVLLSEAAMLPRALYMAITASTTYSDIAQPLPGGQGEHTCR